MKNFMNSFLKILGYFIPKIKLYKYNSTVLKKTGLRVYVQMENAFTLIDEKKINKTVRGKIKGNIYFSACFCEPDLTRSFVLAEESDFEAFSVAIKTIEGVIDVKKGQSSGQKTLEKLQEVLSNTEKRNIIPV